jgi:serine protease
MIARSLTLAIALCIAADAHGASITPARAPPMSKSAALALASSAESYDRIVLKFREGSGVRLVDGSLQLPPNASSQDRLQLQQIGSVLRAAGMSPRALFSRSMAELDRRRERIARESARPLADLNLYVKLIGTQPGAPSGRVRTLQQLNQFLLVEVAYFESPMSILNDAIPPGPGDLAPPGITPILVQYQDYLDPAPVGVGAIPSWARAGGKGQGVHVIVYDNAYRQTHEDMPALFYATSENPVSDSHGTAVIGIIAARDNHIGMKGIAHGAAVGFQRAASGGNSVADALMDAADQLDDGDVLLTEIARKVNALGFACPCNPTQANSVPIEFYPAEYDVVAAMTADGITVVETAGNGCVDFDSATFDEMVGNPGSDSGAIWVGAGQSAARAPMCYSNSGARVNLHAWGESVAALAFLREDEIAIFDKGPDRVYGPNFGGTSSAGAIVAGVVASLQGQVKADSGSPLTPAEVRDVLIDTGTAQTGELGRPIGPQPDLEAAATSLLD